MSHGATVALALAVGIGLVAWVLYVQSRAADVTAPDGSVAY